MEKNWKCSCKQLHATRKEANNCDNCIDTISFLKIKEPIYLPWEKDSSDARKSGAPRARRTWSKR